MGNQFIIGTEILNMILRILIPAQLAEYGHIEDADCYLIHCRLDGWIDLCAIVQYVSTIGYLRCELGLNTEISSAMNVNIEISF